MKIAAAYVPATAGIAHEQAAVRSSPQTPDSVSAPTGPASPAGTVAAAGTAEAVGAADTAETTGTLGAVGPFGTIEAAESGWDETAGAVGTGGAVGKTEAEQRTDKRLTAAPDTADTTHAREAGDTVGTRSARESVTTRNAENKTASRNAGDTTAVHPVSDTGTLHPAGSATTVRAVGDTVAMRNSNGTTTARIADKTAARNAGNPVAARETGDTVGGRTPGDSAVVRPDVANTHVAAAPDAGQAAASESGTNERRSEAPSRSAATTLLPAGRQGQSADKTERTAAIHPARTTSTAGKPRTTAGSDSGPVTDSATTACARCGTADSLLAPQPLLFAATEAVVQSPYRDTTAQAVFGTESVVLVPDRLSAPQPAPLTGNAVFQGFVLLLAATYAMLLYHNPGDVRSLLSRITRDTIAGKRLSEESVGSGFPRFLNLATGIGMLFMGVAIVKYGEWLMPRTPNDALSHGTVLGLSLLATLVTALLALYQWIVVRAAGAVTLTQPFITRLVLLKRTYFSLAVIAASPALLLFALSSRGEGHLWSAVVAGVLCLTAACYLWETLRLFLSKKISILHWFLYLCAVEIFPVSLLWLLAAR